MLAEAAFHQMLFKGAEAESNGYEVSGQRYAPVYQSGRFLYYGCPWHQGYIDQLIISDVSA